MQVVYSGWSISAACWGSSDYSARLAARLGFPFAFAAHLANENVFMALEAYRENFRPSEVLDRPYVIASFGVMAADDAGAARAEAWAYSHAMMRMSTRRSFVVPTADEAANYQYAPTERRIMEMRNAKIISGTGVEVGEKLKAWQQRLDADELMILNQGNAPAAIHRSTEVIADALGLPQDVAG